MPHERQAPDVAYDAIQGRYYIDDKAKQRAFRDRVADDPDVQRGVTISHRDARLADSGRVKNGGRITLLFGGE